MMDMQLLKRSVVVMPRLSSFVKEGTLAKWLVKVGDVVKSGQVIAEIETDKATMEYEAFGDGIVMDLLVAEGTAGVKVGTPIAVLNLDVVAISEARQRAAAREEALLKSNPNFGMF